MWRGCAAGALACTLACGGGQQPASPDLSDDLRTLDQTQWTWANAICDDGTHQLAARGFEDQLRITSIGGGMRMTHEIGVATDGCNETLVRWVSPDGSAFRFKDLVRVAETAERTCLQAWPSEQSGEVLRRGDTLELRHYRSALCGGYDVRHIYRAVTTPTRDDRTRIRDLVAGLVLRDPSVIARDYAEQASLRVPKPAADGGGQIHHEGRAAITGWFSLLVRSVAWIGARIVQITELAPGRYLARLEYMDDALQAPLTIDLTLQFADGEIYEAQWSLVSPIVPRASSADAGVTDATVGDAGTEPVTDNAATPATPRAP